MRRDRTAVIAGILPALLALGACRGEGGSTPDRAEEAVEPADAADAVTPARYLTGFAFTGTVSGSTRLYLELVNETSDSALAREYRGWIAAGDEGWAELLFLRDTVPVPRAAWRVLPGAGLRVLVGDGSELVGLAYSDSARRIRLQPSRAVAEWTGPTGQRELLALATLERDSVSEPGLLYFRRAARTAGAPADPAADRLFLIGDTRGNGFLIAGTDADTAGSAFAWGWLRGTRSRWRDVELRPADEGDGDARSLASVRPSGPTRWTLEIPSAGITGELRLDSAIGPEALSSSQGDAREAGTAERPEGSGRPPGEKGILLLSGTLDTVEGSRSVRGIVLQGRLP